MNLEKMRILFIIGLISYEDYKTALNQSSGIILNDK